MNRRFLVVAASGLAHAQFEMMLWRMGDGADSAFSLS
jgi:hypothetical protein